MSNSMKVAVVTGGHRFDVPNFHGLFRNLQGVDAYIQPLEDFASAHEQARDFYDVAVFYNMHKEGPTDANRPGWMGRPRTALGAWLATGKGVVLLHHAILAFPDWMPWVEMAGVSAGSFESFSHDEVMPIRVVDRDHPITQGLSDWEMIDETYVMGEPDATSRVLLTTTHPKCMQAIGWTRHYENTRVFCLQSGHDNQTWQDDNFQTVLLRGIQWVSGRL